MPVVATRSVIEALGYRVTAVADGEQALAVLDETDAAFSLVITDVVMPGIGGKELGDRIRQRWPALRGLFVSGHTDDVVLRHGIREGEVSFLKKPYSPEDLARRIRTLLDATSEIC